MIARRSLVASIAALVAITTLAAGAGDPKPAPARKRIVDPAVVPAGGVCKQCSTGGCRHHSGGHHHAGCRNGICEPSCPVRPGQFGYYGTQWRKWPGTGVVPVSASAAATPAQPPRSAVPSVDEESLEPKQPPGALPPPAADPLPAPAAAPRGRGSRDVEPTTPPAAGPADAAPEPMEETPETAQPEPQPAVKPDAKPEPKPAPAADDNLFDEARNEPPAPSTAAPRNGAWPAARPATEQPASQTKPAAWQPVVQPRSVPRVPFSPTEESAALKTRMQQLRQR